MASPTPPPDPDRMTAEEIDNMVNSLWGPEPKADEPLVVGPDVEPDSAPDDFDRDGPPVSDTDVF